MDGTLSAVVAADRLALSDAGEGKDLLHRRLTVFYGYFALVGVLAVLAGRMVRFPGVGARELDLLSSVQAAHAIVTCAVLAGLRARPRSPRTLHVLDGVGIASTAMTAAVGMSIVPYAVAADVTVVGFFILFFALRAALVPGKPWLATLAAALTAVPFTVGLASMYGRAQLPDPDAATFTALRVMAAGIAGVYLVSRTIYGLRRVVAQAVQLGQYVVHEKIGEGGMGAVYRASHAMLKRPTAIKLIAAERAGATASARFEREVLAASRLSHPNNLAIYDFGRTRGGVFYYAMELLDGEDLARLVEREGAQPVARTLHILAQVTAALAEAHEAGLVHRDVKPANVMLCTRGGVRDFVKVLDFGLVKDVAATPDAAKLTADAAFAMGTPLYMAPEAIVAPATVAPPADVYALGCIAYFLLTGRPPFDAAAVFEVFAAHVCLPPDPPSLHAPGAVPAELDALVLRCLDKDPSRRPGTRALGDELAQLALRTHANEVRTPHDGSSGERSLPSPV